jgi:hypothetical protein
VEVEFSDNITFNGAKKPGQNAPVTVGFVQGPVPGVYRKGKPGVFSFGH